MGDVTPAHLEPSELGTKEYWDATYAADLSQDPPRPDSPLDGWFADVKASTRILRWLSSPSLNLDKKTTSFLDLGTGNGEMLFLLREEGGFEGSMLGIDYSQQSVEHCRKLAEIRGLDAKDGLRFEVCDIMKGEDLDVGEGFDVVLDKGTFDAISLSDETDQDGRRLCEGYRQRVERLVKNNGVLVVTSCNWTESELKHWLSGGQLVLMDSLEYPVLRFGGQTGQSVCSVAFRRASEYD